MWNLVFESAPGTSHERASIPCQDRVDGRVIDTPAGPTLIVACADGAGSAPRSEEGARLAVEAFLSAVEADLIGGDVDLATAPESLRRGWIEASRRRILDEADGRGMAAGEFACTFLGAVVGPDASAFVQIGDGVIVTDGPDGYEHRFWPDSGEYANSTYFLTDRGFASRVRLDLLDRPVRDLAMMTDGLQGLALDYAGKRVFAPFFESFFEAVRSAPDGEILRAPLAAFLVSDRVNELTDDDKTLLLASRVTRIDHDTDAPPDAV